MVMTAAKQMDYNVSNLTRGLDILELLLVHPAGVGISEIAQALEIPKNAAFRITSALHERGYLVRFDQNKYFKLSKRLMLMGYKAADEDGLIEKAMPRMKKLRDLVKETVVLGGIMDDQGLAIAEVPGAHSFRFVVDAGMRYHLHSSASGKAMMAMMAEDERDHLLGRLKLKKFTSETITSKEGLLGEFAKIRKQGYAEDRSEEMAGVHCVAASVMNAQGLAIASVTVTGPAYRFTRDMFAEIGENTRRCAAAISADMGYEA